MSEYYQQKLNGNDYDCEFHPVTFTCNNKNIAQISDFTIFTIHYTTYMYLNQIMGGGNIQQNVYDTVFFASVLFLLKCPHKIFLFNFTSGIRNP